MKKSKVMLIAVIGALVLLVGAGVARCAFTPHGDEGDGAPSEASQQAERGEEGEAQDLDAEAEDGEAASLSAALSVGDYLNTRWVADDGGELSMLDGVLIEDDASGSVATYYVIEDATQKDDVMTLTVLAAERTGDAGYRSIIVIDATGAVPTVTSDVFRHAKAYKLAPEETSAVTIQAVTDDLNSYLEATTSEITSTLSTYVAQNLPGAKALAWTGEAYTDYFADTKVTTFIADDPAATTLSLIRNADGTLSVS